MCDEGRLSYKRFQTETRVLQPFLRRNDTLVPLAWSDVTGAVAQKLSEVRQAHGAGAIGSVVSAQATNEEIHLFRRLFADTLGGVEVAGLSVSPPDASHDDILRDADKNPNTNGLRALGVDLDGLPTLLNRVKQGVIKALVVWRADLSQVLGVDDLKSLMDHIEYLVVADMDGHATASLADAVLPLASFAEMDGTFTNRSRRVQRIRAAFPPPGEAKAGWQVLDALGAQLGEWKASASAEAVFADAASSTPAYTGLSYESIGAGGAPCAEV